MIQDPPLLVPLVFNHLKMAHPLPDRESGREWQFMTLKIERFRARVRLSGELRSERLDTVRAELRKCGNSTVLDLEEVSLADIEGVRFLNECEAKGISVVHCSPYITEWMLRERAERKKSEAEKGEKNEICRE